MRSKLQLISLIEILQCRNSKIPIYFLFWDLLLCWNPWQTKWILLGNTKSKMIWKESASHQRKLKSNYQICFRWNKSNTRSITKSWDRKHEIFNSSNVLCYAVDYYLFITPICCMLELVGIWNVQVVCVTNHENNMLCISK